MYDLIIIVYTTVLEKWDILVEKYIKKIIRFSWQDKLLA